MPIQHPTVWEVKAGAFKDIAQVSNSLVRFQTALEIEDSIRPKIISASLNYGTGVLTIVASEIINADPTYAGRYNDQFPKRGVDLELMYLYNYGSVEPFTFSEENDNATIAGTRVYLKGVAFDGVINDNF